MIVELSRVSKIYWSRPSLTRLWRYFRGRPQPQRAALDDVSFAVGQGSTLGVVGRNGSGKSTLLKVIAGLIPPTTGRVATRGRVAGLLEPGSGFDPDYSGRQNLRLVGTIMGLGPAELARRLDAMIAFSGLEADIDRPVREYSAGMFMRLSFSLATSVDADVLVVDEVLAVGDTAFRARCQERLARFRRAGGTLVITGHDMGQLADWCDQVVWLERGQVRGLGAPREIIARYMDRIACPAEEASPDRETGVLAVELRDGEGRPCRDFRPEDSLRISLKYRLGEPVREPVFGLMINRWDGTCCFGTNTRIAGLSTARSATGDGAAELLIERLQLLPGRYLVAAAIQEGAGRVLDVRMTAAEFRVAGDPLELGVFRPEHRWIVAG